MEVSQIKQESLGHLNDCFFARESFFDLPSIPSVNSQYAATRRRGRGRRIYKKNTVASFQQILEEKGQDSALSRLLEGKPYKSGEWAFEICLLFLLQRKLFWRRDVSNMIKSSEDAIARIIQVQDHWTLRIHSFKFFMQEKSPEGICVYVIGHNIKLHETLEKGSECLMSQKLNSWLKSLPFMSGKQVDFF